MPVFMANEVWQEIKRYINTVDRAEAAETLVNVLVDNDVGVDEIRDTFKGDSDIKRALQQYQDDHAEDEEEEFDDDGWDEEDDY